MSERLSGADEIARLREATTKFRQDIERRRQNPDLLDRIGALRIDSAVAEKMADMLGIDRKSGPRNSK